MNNHTNPQQSSAQPSADASLDDLVAQMSAVQVSNGPEHRTQQDADLLAAIMTLHTERFDKSRPDIYFAALDDGYRHVMKCHQNVERSENRLAFFLGGITRLFPELFVRHCNTIVDGSFRWAPLFRDMAYCSLLGRFQFHPAAWDVAALFEPGADRGSLEGMGYLEIWEAVVGRAPKGGDDEVMNCD